MAKGKAAAKEGGWCCVELIIVHILRIIFDANLQLWVAVL